MRGCTFFRSYKFVWTCCATPDIITSPKNFQSQSEGKVFFNGRNRKVRLTRNWKTNLAILSYPKLSFHKWYKSFQEGWEELIFFNDNGTLRSLSTKGVSHNCSILNKGAQDQTCGRRTISSCTKTISSAKFTFKTHMFLAKICTTMLEYLLNITVPLWIRVTFFSSSKLRRRWRENTLCYWCFRGVHWRFSYMTLCIIQIRAFWSHFPDTLSSDHCVTKLQTNVWLFGITR